MAAWEALDHWRGHAAVGLAFDRARPVRPWRSEGPAFTRTRVYVPYHLSSADIENGIATRALAEGEMATIRMDAAGLRIAAGVGRVTLPAIAHHPCTHARREQRHVRLPGIPLEPMVEVACIDCGAVLETRTEADELARANRASPPPRP
jgi:hypothetical protein